VDEDAAVTRRGFTIVEVLVAVTILAGVILGMSEFTRRFTRATTDASAVGLASDVATAQLETVKAWRTYGTLVATYHDVSLVYPSESPYRGLTRRTLAVRTGPTATADHVTVTVIVSGPGLETPVRRTTIIAAF
jgi:prepilin-type N-terminal cleavage/methylation domain-containing protein